MEILIIGNGKLANALKTEMPKYVSDCIITEWGNKTADKHYDVMIHAGSGREFKDSFEYGKKQKIPYIQASTGLDVDTSNIDFTYLDVPNGNLLIVKFLYMLHKHGKLFSEYTIDMMESHQESKKTVPGTAAAIADSLCVDHAGITSIRDPRTQTGELKIPDAYLHKHAVHVVKIFDGNNCSVEFKTQVLGTGSYVQGFAHMVKIISGLEKKYYNAVDLVEMALL